MPSTERLVQWRKPLTPDRGNAPAGNLRTGGRRRRTGRSATAIPAIVTDLGGIRYLSWVIVGYLLTSDASHAETHAWAEAFVPEIGWVGFDPANRLCPTERYVRLGCGLDAADAAPVRGNVSGNHQERLSASVDISEAAGQTQFQNQDGQAQTQPQQ